MKKYLLPVIMLALFEAVAITLWLTKDNLFYLFNFSYIGCAIALGLFLFIRKHRHARRVTQLLVGLYMLVYLGLICNENMQIEGFWYYLFTGVFEAATIHYAVAKIFGPLIFGRGWCGYACWTAMVLDFLPYKVPQQPRKKLGWIRYLVFAASLVFVGRCFFPMWATWSKSCSGPLSSETCCTMPSASVWRFFSGTTGPSASTSARSPSF